MGRAKWGFRALCGALGGLLVLCASACDLDDEPSEDGGVSPGSSEPNERSDGGGGFGNANPQAGDGGTIVRADAGGDGGFVDGCEDGLEVKNVDLLFMVDNSGSMREEQAALQREFPRIIRAFTTGDRDGDGVQDFPPVENLHLGVVSSDLGLVGIQGIPLCDGLGDDGLLQNVPVSGSASCTGQYPRFLSYDAASDDPEQAAEDFACISALGTEGCGFEQQLESALKALWPSDDSRVTFLGDVDGFGTSGQGDTSNAGFLRPADGEDTSVLAIVMVTDEEDCSSSNTRHFTPDTFLPAGDPLKTQGLNLRCFLNSQNLYPTSRYVEGFRALRPGAEQLVLFGAIVGVPPDLVDHDALAAVDFEDRASREAFYDSILDDSRMQEVPDDRGTPEYADDWLVPSCETEIGKAYPPRRIVQVAREFGPNAIVQSICQSDFSPAIDAIVAAIGRTVERGCVVD